jgi:hypothetical protein
MDRHPSRTNLLFGQMPPDGGRRDERETAMNSDQNALHVCIICRFPAELDDAVVPTSGGQCICLRCFARETGSARPFDRWLRQEVDTVLAEIEQTQPA